MLDAQAVRESLDAVEEHPGGFWNVFFATLSDILDGEPVEQTWKINVTFTYLGNSANIIIWPTLLLGHKLSLQYWDSWFFISQIKKIVLWIFTFANNIPNIQWFTPLHEYVNMSRTKTFQLLHFLRTILVLGYFFTIKKDGFTQFSDSVSGSRSWRWVLWKPPHSNLQSQYTNIRYYTENLRVSQIFLVRMTLVDSRLLNVLLSDSDSDSRYLTSLPSLP